MGTLLYPRMLDNSRYRKFLHQTFPCIGHVGIIHMQMSPLIGAAKKYSYGKIEIDYLQWTDKITFIRPLISRNLDNLMMNLRKIIHSVFAFANPKVGILDSEWGEAYFERRKFIGQLCVLLCNCPGEQNFDLIVHVSLKPVKLELWFEKSWNVQVHSFMHNLNYPDLVH